MTAGVVGAHGGSGATTLARALHLPELTRADARDLEVVVLSAATHAHAARRVVETVAELGPDPHLVLALTSTGWWTSPETRSMRRLLADRLDAVVELPWVWRWHDQPTPSAATATTGWRAAAIDLATAIGQRSTHPEGAHHP